MSEKNEPNPQPVPATSAETAARPVKKDESHWYSTTGEACYEVQGKSTGKPRPANLGDARQRNLLPSVTTILQVINKPGLELWKQEQVALAIITATRLPGEKDDAFAKRVLQEEEQHKQEGKKAADLGKRIHESIDNYFGGTPTEKGLEPYIMPAIFELEKFGNVIDVEKTLIGFGYAGRTDLLQQADQEAEEILRIWDIKSAKKLPEKGPWHEHKLQLAAYAEAQELELRLAAPEGKKIPRIICANLYVSTTEPGKFVVWEHEDWKGTYKYGFKPLVDYWQWANQHYPSQPELKALLEGVEEAIEGAPVKIKAGGAEIHFEESKAAALLSNPTAQKLGTLHGKTVVWNTGTPAIPSTPE